jgi:hypothetical protein
MGSPCSEKPAASYQRLHRGRSGSLRRAISGQIRSQETIGGATREGWRLGGWPVGAGGARMFQHGFAQPFGIKLIRFRKLDDPMSDHIIRDIAAIN